MVRAEHLLAVEQKLNDRCCRGLMAAAVMSKQEIDAALLARGKVKTAADYVLELLPERGFRDKKGQADNVRFYKYARIEPDVWSTFVNNTHAPSKETLLKIVIGLRLKESEAREFLALAGSGFHDFRDSVLLACMDCGYYEVEDVYIILEEYGSFMINGKRRFSNIYRSIN